MALAHSILTTPSKDKRNWLSVAVYTQALWWSSNSKLVLIDFCWLARDVVLSPFDDLTTHRTINVFSSNHA